MPTLAGEKAPSLQCPLLCSAGIEFGQLLATFSLSFIFCKSLLGITSLIERQGFLTHSFGSKML